MELKVVSTQVKTKVHGQITDAMLREAFGLPDNAEIFVEYNYGDHLDIKDNPIEVHIENVTTMEGE